LFARAPAERAAGSRDHDRVDRLGRAALEALVEGGMLAVDREKAPFAARVGRCGEVAARDDALLVRKSQVDAVLEAPQRRGQTGEADDGVHDEIGLRTLEQLRVVAPDVLERGAPVDRLCVLRCGAVHGTRPDGYGHYRL